MFSCRFATIALLATAVLLSGCMGSLSRDDTAAKAKIQMVGLSKEDVLACMGIPKKKAAEGTTEVWSYPSTDGLSTWNKAGYNTGSGRRSSYSSRSDSFNASSGSSEKRFCIVNVVMKDGVVGKVKYLGPKATSFYNDDDQCGYAVAACVR